MACLTYFLFSVEARSGIVCFKMHGLRRTRPSVRVKLERSATKLRKREERERVAVSTACGYRKRNGEDQISSDSKRIRSCKREHNCAVVRTTNDDTFWPTFRTGPKALLCVKKVRPLLQQRRILSSRWSCCRLSWSNEIARSAL
jgi:hypothetical protein